MQICYLTVTLALSQNFSLTYRHTPPPLSFPVCLPSLSILKGSPNPSTLSSLTFLSINQVSEKQSKAASLNSLVKRQLAKSSSKLWLGLVGLTNLTLETIILGRASLVLFRLILLFTPPLFPRFRRFRSIRHLSREKFEREVREGLGGLEAEQKVTEVLLGACT